MRSSEIGERQLWLGTHPEGDEEQERVTVMQVCSAYNMGIDCQTSDNIGTWFIGGLDSELSINILKRNC